ncbi:GNAT family N-acetyltransferase [Rhizobium sp. YJ-22]|uniref:GNAT family N-acetyltransferase n=1 Tax=Rhizobium sp. YJ-22 TaxID=3037556 RepID=UPI00241253D1|nr:GNAT family N-acetyltransferase [Rhizobium sp. YJ-22]MDG3577053.1 GNAT family N-acetyltransferase [Rhizobium sp. YJ-22]
MIGIRRARDDEASILADIGLSAWKRAVAGLGASPEMERRAANAFTGFVREAWRMITVVERNGRPAGWAAREAANEVISDFWIDPAFARQGLGAALLALIEKDIRRQGFDSVSLQTHARNEPAIAFFKRNGYRVQWLSVVYAPKLDRDIESVGLSKQLEDGRDVELYGPGSML